MRKTLCVLFLVLAAPSILYAATGTVPLKPKAGFNAWPRSGPAPLTVAFVNQSENASQFIWSFGDSVASKEDSPVHTYTKPGIYSVSLKASNGSKSNQKSQKKFIEVTGNETVVDLVPVGILGPSTIKVGETFELTDTVGNAGTGEAGEFKVSVYLSKLRKEEDQYKGPDPSQDPLITYRTVQSLSPNGLSSDNTYEMPVRIPDFVAPGTYYLGMIVDSSNNVSELNGYGTAETNNSLVSVSPITVTGEEGSTDSLSDLVPSGAFGPSTAKPGDTIEVFDTVANAGTQAAGQFTVSIYLSGQEQVDTSKDLFLTYRTVQSLQPDGISSGTSYATEAKIPDFVTPGAYYLGVVVDSGNNVAESNEGNNTKVFNPLTIVGPEGGTDSLPDLAPVALFGPSTAQIGDTIELADTVQNIGSKEAGEFTVGIYLMNWENHPDQDTGLPPVDGNGNPTCSDKIKPDPTKDPLITYRTVQSLQANGLSSASTSQNTYESLTLIPDVVTPGTYCLGLIADSGNSVAESNEINNSIVSVNTIMVSGPQENPNSKPDLVPLTVFGPDVFDLTLNPCDSEFGISVTVKNQGNRSVGAFSVGLYISKDQIIDPKDDAFLDYVTFSGLGTGAEASQVKNIKFPKEWDYLGPYYFGVKVDPLDEVTESQEDNNSGELDGNGQPIYVQYPVTVQ